MDGSSLTNHSITDNGEATSLPSSEAKTPGGEICGGQKSHNLEPVRHAFQAEVPLGSYNERRNCKHKELFITSYQVTQHTLWNVLPLFLGPIISHLQSGRLSSPMTLNKSSAKYSGTLYISAISGAFLAKF